MERTKMSNNVS